MTTTRHMAVVEFDDPELSRAYYRRVIPAGTVSPTLADLQGAARHAIDDARRTDQRWEARYGSPGDQLSEEAFRSGLVWCVVGRFTLDREATDAIAP